MTANATTSPRQPASFVEFMRFVATGSIAAIINLGARYALNFVMPFEAAVALAYLAGMVVAFFLFQRLIFEASGTPLRRRMIRFTQVNLLGGVLSWIVSMGLARGLLPAAGWMFHPLEIAHFVGVCVPAFSSYFLHKYYTFR